MAEENQRQVPARHFTANVPVPSKLRMEGSLSENWKKFSRCWENYEIASRLNKEDREYRCAVLLACIGEDAVEIYEGLQFTEGENKKDIEVVLRKFEEFCVGATHEAFETYKFHIRSQESSETIDAYVAALRKLAKNCNFDEMEDRILRDRIVVGVKCDAVREKLLEDSTLTFKKAVDICRAIETSQRQLQEMSKEVTVDQLKSSLGGKPRSKRWSHKQKKESSQGGDIN